MVNNLVNKLTYVKYATEDLLLTQQNYIDLAGQRADKRLMRELEKLKRQGKVRAISINEMWSYVGKKGKEVWI